MIGKRAKAAGIHLLVVGLSFALSVIVLRWVDPYPAAAIDAVLFYLLVTHTAAAMLGFLLPSANKVSCVIVFVIAFLTAACFGAAKLVQKKTYFSDDAPYAAHRAFAECLGLRIPQSVSNLRFVPMKQRIRPDWMFQFDMSVKDMNAILNGLKLERVDPGKMLNPQDFFQYAYYLPMAGDSELYQGKDKYGNVLTIKTNAGHSHGVFRLETPRFYEEPQWEKRSPIVAASEDSALARMQINQSTDR